MKALLGFVSISNIWIRLVPRTNFVLLISIRLSTTTLEVSSFHLWMASLAIIRLIYYPLISIRRHSFSHGEPLHIGSYLLAWKMLEPVSSMWCPMRFTILNILLNCTLMTSLLIHSDRRTILVILETYSWDVVIIIYSSICINVSFSLRQDIFLALWYPKMATR